MRRPWPKKPRMISAKDFRGGQALTDREFVVCFLGMSSINFALGYALQDGAWVQAWAARTDHPLFGVRIAAYNAVSPESLGYWLAALLTPPLAALVLMSVFFARYETPYRPRDFWGRGLPEAVFFLLVSFFFAWVQFCMDPFDLAGRIHNRSWFMFYPSLPVFGAALPLMFAGACSHFFPAFRPLPPKR